MIFVRILIGLLITLNVSVAQAQILAFPDALGFGKYAEGGRGGDIKYVTNLNDDGVGSLRVACESTGPRTVLFKIGGTITLNSTIEISNPNITIAGQTAPGGGICLRMNPESNYNNLQATLAILTDHVIIRGLRFRAGPNNMQTVSQIHDCLDIWDGENIIIDHCSFTWGADENIAIWSDIINEHPQKITIQNSIIGQSLQKLESGNITRGFGMLVGGSVGASEVSIVKNLFIHNAQRNPLLKSEQASTFEVSNNVVYNYGFFGTDLSDKVMVDLIANYYLEGNNTATNRYEVLINEQASLFAEGNIGLHRSENTLPEWNIVGFNGTIPPDGYSESPAPLAFQSTTPFSSNSTQVISANEIYIQLMNNLDIGANFKLNENGNGEFINNLDDVDFGLLQDLITNSGTSIFDTDIGNLIQYPILEKGKAPIDSDEDGMPDAWEKSCGLNINNDSDGNEIDDNGYTNLENYLNGIPCSISSTNTNILARNNNIQIYPNPTDELFKLEGKIRNYKIDIFNYAGILVQTIIASKNSLIVNIGNLPSGVYFLKLTDMSSNQNIFEKIVKQ